MAKKKRPSSKSLEEKIAERSAAPHQTKIIKGNGISSARMSALPSPDVKKISLQLFRSRESAIQQ
jgi:hypothetical protein